jgi:predicted deacylase
VPYHTNAELLDLAASHVGRAGARAKVVTIGETVRGREIRAVVVGREPPGDGARSRVLLTGNVHGAEVIGSEVALAVVERLCDPEPDGAASDLLDLADVTVVPAVNLDSRHVAVTDFLAGRWRCRAPRGNANGVDLNRNFPFPKGAKDVWYPLSGTTIRWLPWYRGPAPLSEPEARAVADLGRAERFAAAINLHSVSRKFLYPYCYSHREPADLAAFLAMGEAYVSAQPRHRYVIKQSRSWYAILGDLDDYLYDTFGTLSVTVELSTPFAGVGRNPLRLLCPFAAMNPRDPAPSIENNVDAILATLAAAVRIKQADEGSASLLPRGSTIA